MTGAAARERAIDEFLAHYAAGRYFDAHEALEGAWHRSDEEPMRAMQGLIQWAVALEHHRRGNARGARALLERALGNLESAPAGSLGLDLSACHAAAPDLRTGFAAWEDGGDRPDIAAPPIARAGGGEGRVVG